MDSIKLRRVASYTTVEATDYFEINPEPFKLLVKNTPFYGDTLEEFMAYINNMEDCNSVCDELDELGYIELADNLDMLVETAETEEIEAQMSDWYYEEI